MGDAFYRWDGFSKYASFLEFLPGLSLASILWSLLAFFSSVVIWLLFSFIESLFKRAGWGVRAAHLMLYALFLVLSGAMVWKLKKLVWPLVQTTSEVKLIVLLCLAVISLLFSWVFRERAGQWVGIIEEKLTPLVWLFGIFVLCSVPLVAYHTLWKQPDGLPVWSAQTQSTDKERPNILLITFDALTARNMSVFGYERDTTPFISEWTKGATLFGMAEAASNFTASATASIMTGKRVWTHQTYHMEGTRPVNSRVESLPSVLKEHGYFNMAYVVNPHIAVRILGMEESFNIAPPAYEFSEPASLVGWQFGVLDVFFYKLFGKQIRMYDWILKDDFILKKLLHNISRDFATTTVPPEKVFGAFIDDLSKGGQRPFFAWIHVFPPHDPYLPSGPYKHKYNPSSEFRTWKTQEQVKVDSYNYLFQYRRFQEDMQPAVDLMRDYYDEFILHTDEKLKKFIGELTTMGIENTVIILSADHGDSFEHGYFTHGGPFLYEQVTHVPLIIKEPGQQSKKVINDLVSQIDVPATILDLAKIKVPSWMEGRSLVPLIRGESLPDKPVFSMNFEGNRSRGHQISKGSIAVWEGDYKLIHYLEKNESLLFNLKQDPDELNDRNDTEPEVGMYLLGLIRDHLDKANERIVTERMDNNALPE